MLQHSQFIAVSLYRTLIKNSKQQSTMKRIARTTLAVAAIVAGMAFGAKAQEKSVRLDPLSKDLYQFTYLSQGECNVLVEVLDKKGNVLHTERIKRKNSFTKPYNFHNLQLGEYSFKITDAEGVYLTKLKRTEEVHMVASIKKLGADKAEVIVKGEFMAPVSVNIFDSHDVLVFDDYIDHENSFSKVYDLSKVKADELKIEVVSESKMLATAEF